MPERSHLKSLEKKRREGREKEKLKRIKSIRALQSLLNILANFRTIALSIDRVMGAAISTVCLVYCLRDYLTIREPRSTRNRKTESPDDAVRPLSRAIFLSFAG